MHRTGHHHLVTTPDGGPSRGWRKRPAHPAVALVSVRFVGKEPDIKRSTRPGVAVPLQSHLTAAAGLCLALPVSPAIMAATAVVGLSAIPRVALPAIAVMAVKGLGNTHLAGQIIGQLRLTDLCLVAYVVRHVVTSRALGRPPAHAVASAAFLAWATIVTVASGVSYSPMLRIGLYVVAGLCLARDRQSRDFLQVAIVGYAFVELTLSIREVPNRLFGVTLDDPALFGTLMAVAGILVGLRVKPLPARLALLSYLGVGVVFCQTRSVWFATAVTVAVVFLHGRGRLVPILAPAVGALIGLPLVPWLSNLANLNSESGTLRAESMTLAVQTIRDHPLAGLGWAYASAADALVRANAYNMWLFVGASTGAIGLALFTTWILLTARDLGARDRVGYLVLTLMLAMGLSEMPIYAGSIASLIFLLLISPPPAAAPRDAPDVPSAPRQPRAAPPADFPGVGPVGDAPRTALWLPSVR